MLYEVITVPVRRCRRRRGGYRRPEGLAADAHEAGGDAHARREETFVLLLHQRGEGLEVGRGFEQRLLRNNFV